MLCVPNHQLSETIFQINLSNAFNSPIIFRVIHITYNASLFKTVTSSFHETGSFFSNSFVATLGNKSYNQIHKGILIFLLIPMCNVSSAIKYILKYST